MNIKDFIDAGHVIGRNGRARSFIRPDTAAHPGKIPAAQTNKEARHDRRCLKKLETDNPDKIVISALNRNKTMKD